MLLLKFQKRTRRRKHSDACIRKQRRVASTPKTEGNITALVALNTLGNVTHPSIFHFFVNGNLSMATGIAPAATTMPSSVEEEHSLSSS
eukprot:1526823-Ditylum_brightwellii.AAC.1